MFDAVLACKLDAGMLGPLIRVLSLFSLKRGLQPAACGGQRWQQPTFVTCQEAIVSCLERLDQGMADPEGAWHARRSALSSCLCTSLRSTCASAGVSLNAVS